MSKLLELEKMGQSIWLDYIQRSLITSGELKQMVDKGLRGVTSNPAIFEKAIAGSNDYDDDLKQLIKTDRSIEQIYEALAIKDIELATDTLRGVSIRPSRLTSSPMASTKTLSPSMATDQPNSSLR